MIEFLCNRANRSVPLKGRNRYQQLNKDINSFFSYMSNQLGLTFGCQVTKLYHLQKVREEKLTFAFVLADDRKIVLYVKPHQSTPMQTFTFFSSHLKAYVLRTRY